MAQKAKLEIVKQEPEVVKPEIIGDAPDNVALDEIHKYTMQQLVGSGRHVKEMANRIIFSFPDAKVECKKPRSVFNRMVQLANKK